MRSGCFEVELVGFVVVVVEVVDLAVGGVAGAVAVVAVVGVEVAAEGRCRRGSMGERRRGCSGRAVWRKSARLQEVRGGAEIFWSSRRSCWISECVERLFWGRLRGRLLGGCDGHMRDQAGSEKPFHLLDLDCYSDQGVVGSP